jgi:hypothetical protein
LPWIGGNVTKLAQRGVVMVKECEILKTCGFFKKYQQSKDLVCKGFIMMYCQGPKIDQCKRKEYLEKHGKSPDDDMMPNGSMIVE